MEMLFLEFPNCSIGNLLKLLNNSAELKYNSILVETYGLDKNDEIG